MLLEECCKNSVIAVSLTKWRDDSVGEDSQGKLPDDKKPQKGVYVYMPGGSSFLSCFFASITVCFVLPLESSTIMAVLKSCVYFCLLITFFPGRAVGQTRGGLVTLAS